MFVVAGVLAGLAGDLGVTVGVTVGAAGTAATVLALAYAIGAPRLGALLGARPLRQVLIGSVGLFGVLTVMSAVAPTHRLGRRRVVRRAGGAPHGRGSVPTRS
jgi:predicted MFS family arabinose efflux permease